MILFQKQHFKQFCGSLRKDLPGLQAGKTRSFGSWADLCIVTTGQAPRRAASGGDVHGGYCGCHLPRSQVSAGLGQSWFPLNHDDDDDIKKAYIYMALQRFRSTFHSLFSRAWYPLEELALEKQASVTLQKTDFFPLQEREGFPSPYKHWSFGCAPSNRCGLGAEPQGERPLGPLDPNATSWPRARDAKRGSDVWAPAVLSVWRQGGAGLVPPKRENFSVNPSSLFLGPKLAIMLLVFFPSAVGWMGFSLHFPSAPQQKDTRNPPGICECEITWKKHLFRSN